LKKEREAIDKLEESLHKSEQEKDRLKMQNSILKSKIQNMSNMLSGQGQGSASKRQAESVNVDGDNAL
jgi:chaperonin cofactor prefoldin